MNMPPHLPLALLLHQLVLQLVNLLQSGALLLSSSLHSMHSRCSRAGGVEQRLLQLGEWANMHAAALLPQELVGRPRTLLLFWGEGRVTSSKHAGLDSCPEKHKKGNMT